MPRTVHPGFHDLRHALVPDGHVFGNGAKLVALSLSSIGHLAAVAAHMATAFAFERLGLAPVVLFLALRKQRRMRVHVAAMNLRRGFKLVVPAQRRQAVLGSLRVDRQEHLPFEAQRG